MIAGERLFTRMCTNILLAISSEHSEQSSFSHLFLYSDTYNVCRCHCILHIQCM